MARFILLACLLGLAGCASYGASSPEKLTWWGVAVGGGDRLFGGQLILANGYWPSVRIEVDRGWEDLANEVLPEDTLDREFASIELLAPGEVRAHRAPRFGGEVRVVAVRRESEQFSDWVFQSADRQRAEGARVYVVGHLDSGATLAVYGTRGWPTELVELGRVAIEAGSEKVSEEAAP